MQMTIDVYRHENTFSTYNDKIQHHLAIRSVISYLLILKKFQNLKNSNDNFEYASKRDKGKGKACVCNAHILEEMFLV